MSMIIELEQLPLFPNEVQTGFVHGFRDEHNFYNIVGYTSDKRTQIIATQNPDVKPFGLINGIPVDFSRSENAWQDAIFISGLIQAHRSNGGVVIAVDHRDDYGRYDRGQHYALISPTTTWGDEVIFRRNAHANMPLPIFTRLIGKGFYWSEEDYDYLHDHDQWYLPDVVEFFNSMFPGRVCIGDGTFHRIDAPVGNSGVVPGLSSYYRDHGVWWQDPLCQTGILPEGSQELIYAYNDPDELLVVQAGEIKVINAQTETEKVLTKGKLTGSLTPGGDSQWKIGVTHPNAPAHKLYEKLDPELKGLKISK